MKSKVFITSALALSLLQSIQAATIEVDTNNLINPPLFSCGIHDALMSAETNTSHGGCTAGDDQGGADVIVLQENMTYHFSEAAHHDGGESMALMPITSAILLEGRGSTLFRDEGLTCWFNNSRSSEEFGFILVKSGGHLEIKDLVLENACTDGAENDKPYGGAINVNEGGVLNVYRSQFKGNKTSNDGGAIGSKGILGVYHSRFESNEAGQEGGAVSSEKVGIIENSHFSHNSSFNGAGLYLLSEGPQESRIIGNEFYDNEAEHAGGGIFLANPEPLVFEHNFIWKNIAYIGGGLKVVLSNNESEMVLKSSTIYNNQAIYLGGGLEISSLGDIKIQNFTIAKNKAESGGGIYVKSSSIKFIHVTAVQNEATNFGELSFVNEFGSLNAIGSILTSDNPPNSCAATIITGTNNYVDDSSCGGDSILTPAPLSPLQHWGGPTPVMMPLDLPLVDNYECDLTVDQRGFDRPSGSDCDLGAVEDNSDVIFADKFDSWD